jgi:hypothetical protein
LVSFYCLYLYRSGQDGPFLPLFSLCLSAYYSTIPRSAKKLSANTPAFL